MALDTVMPNLHLECPHCDHSHGDPLEVLQHTQEDDMRCESCGRTFTFAIVECPQCHEKKLSHRVCKHCGYYNGVQVIDMTEKKENA